MPPPYPAYNKRRGAYPYVFIIKPDGTGLYYDISIDKTKASDTFQCLMLSP